jgi:hypothetical protein
MTCPVDLTAFPYLVVPNDPNAATTNTAAINQAIGDWSGTRARLTLPEGDIYLDRASVTARWSIHFGPGVSDLALVGRGMFASRIIVQGYGRGRDWHGIFVDGANRIELADFGIEHGKIDNADQQTHLITIKDPSRGTPTHDIAGHHLVFGQAIGDGLRLIGDRTPVSNIRFTDFVMHLGGIGRGARSGIALQRGWRFVEFGHFIIDGVRNSEIDLEPSGSAPMEHLNIHDGFIDHAGRSDIAVDLAGIHGDTPQPARHIRFANVTVLGGSVRMSFTQHLTISGLTVLTSPRSRRAVVHVGRANDDVVLDRLRLERRGRVAGNVLHIQNRGGPTTVSNSTFTQVTEDDPVLSESSSNVHLYGSEVRYLARRAAHLHNGIRVAAQVGNANNVDIHDVTVRSVRGKLRSAVTFAARIGSEMLGIRVADVVSAGSASTGLYVSYHPDANVDWFPYMTGIDNGPDATWRQVDQNDNPTITRVCPVISGNRHHVCHMVGQAAPENIAVAMQGSTYTFENGDATQRFVKLTGSGSTGWSAPL